MRYCLLLIAATACLPCGCGPDPESDGAAYGRGFGEIALLCEDDWTNLFCDGRFVATAAASSSEPVILRVDPGVHEIRASAVGRLDVVERIEALDGQRITARIRCGTLTALPPQPEFAPRIDVGHTLRWVLRQDRDSGRPTARFSLNGRRGDRIMFTVQQMTAAVEFRLIGPDGREHVAEPLADTRGIAARAAFRLTIPSDGPLPLLVQGPPASGSTAVIFRTIRAIPEPAPAAPGRPPHRRLPPAE